MLEKVRRSRKLGETAAGYCWHTATFVLISKKKGHRPGNCQIFLGIFAVLQKKKKKKKKVLLRRPSSSRSVTHIGRKTASRRNAAHSQRILAENKNAVRSQNKNAVPL